MKYFFLINLIMLGCISMNGELRILPLSPFVRVDEFNSIVHKERYYIVENYNGSKIHDDSLRRFAFSVLDSADSHLNNYKIIFYKTSSSLSSSFKETPEDLLDWHSKDRIVDFSWRSGMFVRSFLYKDGKIQSNEIEIKDLD